MADGMYSQNLKTVRKALNYSVEEFAKILELPARTIGSWEREERNCSIELVTQLCNKLNVNANWFVTGKGEIFNPKKDTRKDFEQDVADIVNKILDKRGL